MKNPVWKREELILALDLYFRMDYGQMHGKNPHIIRLSEELKRLGLHNDIPEPGKFRSVNSVSLKLANFKKYDQNFKGYGMRDGGMLDREIWNEFHSHRDRLKQEADFIRQLYLKRDDGVVSPPRKSAVDIQLSFQVHKARETDPLAIKLKMESVLAVGDAIKCEICGFDFRKMYGELGEDVMEIHYNKSIKREPEYELSSSGDFIIVCSNCHKVLDKSFGSVDADDLRRIIRKK
jgi:5-methylcytosine-specific restriction protein A